MEFAVIAPTEFLAEFCTQTRLQMVLIQNWKDKYRDFYMARKLKGDIIILDNGAYEGETFNSSRMIDVIEELRPHYVVAYDAPNRHESNLRWARIFQDDVLDKVDGDKPGVIQMVQAEPGSWNRWVHSYLEASLSADVIGIPRNAVFGMPNEEPRAFNRARFLIEMEKIGIRSTKPHHAFGLWGGPAEAFALANVGYRSCDSASPVWRGLHSISMEQYWPDFPFDPNRKTGNSEQGQANLNRVLKSCGYRLERG